LKRLLTVVVVAAIFAFSGNLFAQNLITNGGFELGTPAGVGLANLAGWTNTGGLDNFLDNCTYGTLCPHSGSYDAMFGSVGYHTSLSQSVNTTAGSSYVISFWLANDDGADPQKGSFTSINVSFGGTTLIAATNQAQYGWTFEQFVVTATGSSSLLAFDIRQDPTYYYLDDVSVVQTPEPASIGLLFSGLGLGAGVLRKFRS
jgi:flagellin